jgi:hypothetical protein
MKSPVRSFRAACAVALFLSVAVLPAAEIIHVTVPVSRDTWVSAVGAERDGNNGGASRLKFKGIQEFTLLDGDFSALKGRRIERAVLRLHQASAERLGRVTVSTISAPWVEGTGTNYARLPGAACFRLPGAKPDITAVILSNGGSLWRFADAREPDANGWQSIPVDPSVVQARVDGRSYGFAVLDDVGNEWTREGESFHWRPFPNRFFYSKDQNASVAPRFEIWLGNGPAPDRAPAQESVAQALPEAKAVILPAISLSPAEIGVRSMHVGDLFDGPVTVLHAARGETVWLDLRPGTVGQPAITAPQGFSAKLYSVTAHGDALLPCDLSGKPLLPVQSASPTSPRRWLAEILVPKSARAGRYTIRLAAGCDVPLEVWDFALPDRLSFVPQMNAYGLPDGQEVAYYRMAHAHRSCLNCLRYSWQGRVSDGCAPKTTAGTWDWTAWDRRFESLLDGSAFADLPRGRVPVDNFYLPLNENWPMDHERAYRTSYWIEKAYPESYWAEFRAASAQFARHVANRHWTDTTFEFYLNNKVYFKAERGAWSKCSAPWVFDEPVNTQDFWALRRFGREFLAATGVAPNLVFRCDISRPEWQRDLLDGVCGEEVVSGALRTYRERILARQKRFGQTVFLYGSPNPIGTPNLQCSAWCLDAWCLGADGVVPWNTIGTARSWIGPDATCLFYPTTQGPVPSLRLKAFCHGQQLVEYAVIYTQLSGHDRGAVAAALGKELGIEGSFTKMNEEDAGMMRYESLSPAKLEQFRIRLGSWIAARKPADRRAWASPRRFRPATDRPDESFFVGNNNAK